MRGLDIDAPGNGIDLACGSRADLPVLEIPLDLVRCPLARIAETAPSRGENAQEIAFRHRQLRDRRAQLALVRAPRIDDVGAERAAAAAFEPRRGEALSGA